jgi:N-acetylglucosamine malate deacetylase 1
MSNESQSLLVVVAHPDDEVLGCGATVALRGLQGYKTHLLIVAAGIAGRYGNPSVFQEEIALKTARLKEEMGLAARLLGFQTVQTLDFPDNRLDTVSRMDIAHAIDAVVEKIQPEILFTHHPGDYNWDHSIAFDAVLMAARVNPGEWSPKRIYSFEVPSATERAWQDPARAFHPNVHVDVSATIEKKKQAMKLYESEYRDYPHPRSVEGIEFLARKRGSEVGIEYAEAFCLIRALE